MFKVVKRSGSVFGNEPYTCEFVCDTASDISTLPTSISEGTGGKTAYDNQMCASGSIAIVAENGSESKQYMLNNQDIWCPYSVAAGSSGGGSSGSSITVDFALSNTSENPVANKVIVAALDDKANVGDIPNIKVNEAVNADTVNGHSVNADVPENAKFTDTIPDLSPYVKKTDIPTELPANGGNADTVGGLAANEIANNPNILINPDFKVNQRGQSSYTGAVYGVDRWTGIFGGEIVEVTDYGISATFENNQGIRQFIENSDQYKGKHMTMSVCYNLKKGSYGDRSYCGFTLAYSNSNSNSVIISTGSNETHDEFVVKSVTGVVPSDASNLFFDISANGIVGVKWVKLEIGRIATPFVSPVPAIERLKIQAMDGKINPYVTGSATVAANSNVCVSNHGFTPCAVVWWDGNSSGVAVSFSDTQFNINIASTDARTVNYLIFK